MGSLIIKRVKYSGEKYYFESPEFTTGINIIDGDNGSGKSTLSYFIEFGIGGDIRVFNKDNKLEKYQRIINDKNNFVELLVFINNIEYSLKRFIGTNDIFIAFLDGSVKKFCTRRQDCSEVVFSDWLLDKLKIKRFELSLGETNWFFGFNDIFRLLNYDQDTEPRKIFKAPNSDNFVTDSAIIKKSIFETLMGTSSDEYFLKMNELNEAKLQKKESQYIFYEFNKLNPNLLLALENVRSEEKNLREQMNKLLDSRDIYQKVNTKVDDKFMDIENTKSELIRLSILNSENIINQKSILIEKNKIDKLLSVQQNEIESINKSIFTHEKLNLFDFKICPFCATSVKKEKQKCLCGSTIDENNYEKFLYNSGEYKEILKHKNKSLESIQLSLDYYSNELITLNENIEKTNNKINALNQNLKSAIESVEYSGNSQMINTIDNKIAEVKDDIFKYKELIEVYKTKEKYKTNFERKNESYKSLLKSFNFMKIKYNENNRNTIENFNKIYNELMKISSSKAKVAVIDEDYVPFVDGGDYREKSASVPRRMMYYFTLLSMSLKYKDIKHPHFLLMDTPEEAGIDDITENIILLDKALELSKNIPTDAVGDFQFILTTGINRYPDEYKKFRKFGFNKKNNDFILKEKQNAN